MKNPMLKKLTRREQQIFIHMIDGKTNKEIAYVLDLSRRTIEGHVSHILTKLDVRSRTEATIRYYQYLK